jgi:hypothetical protein
MWSVRIEELRDAKEEGDFDFHCITIVHADFVWARTTFPLFYH